MHDEAVLRVHHDPSRGKTIAIAPRVGYEQFRQMAWNASHGITPRPDGPPTGVVSIAELRAAMGAIPAAVFNQHLLRLERNGIVYLIPPDNPAALTEEKRRASLPHPAGELRSFLLWLTPKPQSAYFWD